MAVAERAHIPFLASALTFDALLAVLPLGLLLLKALGFLLDRTEYFGMQDPAAFIAALLPPHNHLSSAGDPFALVEGMFGAVVNYQSKLTWIAVPAFLWFASRLFAAIRTSLSQIYGARRSKRHHRMVADFFLSFVYGKLRDFGMMGLLLTLVLVAMVMSTTVTLVLGGVGVNILGRLAAELSATASALLLFTLLYRYASPRRMPWRASALAAFMAALGFDVARRLFGWYLGVWAVSGIASIDANVGAAVLFLLWIYWVGLVFLLGAAVAAIYHKREVREDGSEWRDERGRSVIEEE